MRDKCILQKFIRCIAICVLSVSLLAIAPGCQEKPQETTEVKVVNGDVASAEELSVVGVYLDVNTDNSAFSDVKYTISGDIGIVSFRYNGVKAELRGSCKYKEFELAGVDDTGSGNVSIKTVQGCAATYIILNPGRVVFWEDKNISYSLYLYVTSADEVLDEILSQVTFESRYNDRPDVKKLNEESSIKFAEKIIKVVSDKDLQSLSDMMYYPQMLYEGQSAANRDELLSYDKDEIFTDILIEALSRKNTLEEMRYFEDSQEYVIGTNYKNVHFKLMEDGNFLIVKLNN